MKELYCDGDPYVLGLFDPSYVPQLLWYAYVPITAVALLLGGYIFIKDKFSLRSTLFLAIAILFSLNLLNETLQWITVSAAINLFEWHLTSLIQAGIYLATFYFAYVFVNQKLPGPRINILIAILFLPILIMLPTGYNMTGFDVLNCEGVNGYGWIYYYAFQALLMLGVVSLAFTAKERAQNATLSRQHLSIILSATVFLLVMLLVHVFGDVLGDYVIYLAVSISMATFIALVTYSIVAYKTFNVGLIAAQALVLALIVLIGSQFFFVNNNTNRILVSITLLLTAGLGLVLIRSVKKEIEQRKHIEMLARDLEIANARQVTLIHFITHQIKGFVTKSKYIFAELLEGSYGQLPAEAKPLIEQGLASDTQGINTIQEILNASNIKSGKVTYDMKPFDLKTMIEEIISSLKGNADAKGLELKVSLGEALTITGDRAQLINAFKNIIDNAIKYTPKGSVSLTLEQKDGKAVFKEEDTGVGITPEDMKNLFTEGGHGKESTKVNTDSTGFGLYIVKNIIEAHKGRVWAESEGKDKGSRFTIELPL